MMRATLVYHARSGNAAAPDGICAALAAIGWNVEHRLTRRQLEECLRIKSDVIVVAGGDGTVGKVAKRLAGTGLPIAIVPTGTANNVARSLGIANDPTTAILDLARAEEKRIDLGVAENLHTRDYFLEGFGLGVFADVVAEATESDKALPRARGLIADALEDYAPWYFGLEVDGRDLSGKYVLAAIMNGRSFGPALGIAPAARCDDGQLDVALVRPEAQRMLAAYLLGAARDENVVLPEIETTRAREVRVRAVGRWAHIDDRSHLIDGDVRIDISRGAVTMLIPPPRESA